MGLRTSSTKLRARKTHLDLSSVPLLVVLPDVLAVAELVRPVVLEAVCATLTHEHLLQQLEGVGAVVGLLA